MFSSSIVELAVGEVPGREQLRVTPENDTDVRTLLTWGHGAVCQDKL